MKYYQLALICLLALAAMFGGFLITPQRLFYAVTDPGFKRTAFPQVKILSNYPYNDRGEIMISAGSRDGVRPLLPVAVEGQILLGQVAKVFENYSVVRTFFHQGWQTPVRIGWLETDALLEGGLTPRLTMIAKDSPVQAGNWVYAAGRDFPYGAAIGKVKAVSENPTAAFKEAELEFPYNLNDLRDLEVLVK